MEKLLEISMAEYGRWIHCGAVKGALRRELLEIAEKDSAIVDRFCRQLSFGTGGLRGILGAGTNRMNVFTVAQATQGLATYLNGFSCDIKKVVIAYDSRINSRRFAETAAEVLAANGIMAYIFPRLAPTPLLSFAVRELECAAGICITASHNPAEYNGYKVYGADGGQVTLDAAEKIQRQISKIDVLRGSQMLPIEEARAEGLCVDVPETVFDAYIDAVCTLAPPQQENTALTVVYTPLHGAGKECVLRVLERIHVERVSLVSSQAEPDGNFTTCPYPNPEERAALEEGLKLCAAEKPDLLLATDPDCDRVGVAVPDGEHYRLLSGNEMGVLLLDYICQMRTRNGAMPAQPIAVSTIVSTDMADRVAEVYGVELRRTLTGFKYIGEQIGLLEAVGEGDRFIFGFEESYGYLSGSHARDKDAVNAAMLICQMARYYKEHGKTLAQAMDALYAEYGYYRNQLISFSFAGTDGMKKMSAVMKNLRTRPLKDLAGSMVVGSCDYGEEGTGLPKADVLEYIAKNGSKLLIRPSGTEPKLKAYLFVRGDCADESTERLAAFANWVRQILLPHLMRSKR
jgi:hypothetical protein